MAEPYVKAGRGGAGNFYSKQDLDDASNPTGDLESGPSTTLTTTQRTATPPEYLHSGRGGAGNWIKPSELESQGLTQKSTAPSKKPVVGASKPTYRGGRGGAGNYTDYEAEEKAKKVEAEKLREEMEKRVQADVEQGLAKPPTAYRGYGGSFEMM